MINIRRIVTGRWRLKNKKRISFGLLLLLFFIFVRISKGSLYKDFYYFISKPFWPGQSQREIILNSVNQEFLIKFQQLKNDNNRLREILSLKKISESDTITAAVISRKNGSWWRQIILNKGSKDGVEVGSAVIGPGGLLGIVENTSFLTSSVALLTSPESKVGVWLDRGQTQGLMVGTGDDNPKIIFYTKNVDVEEGDFVSSSPASTLLPPNIPIGIIQSVDEKLISTKTANILLLGKPQVIDWVQIIKAKS